MCFCTPVAGRGSISFLVLCLLWLFLFPEQFLGYGSRSAQGQVHGQDRTVYSVSPRQPPWCVTKWSNGRFAKRVLCAWERVCVLVSPKDVLLLIQKPSIAPSSQWVSHLLTCNSGLFQLSKSLCAVLWNVVVDVLCPQGDCTSFCEI